MSIRVGGGYFTRNGYEVVVKQKCMDDDGVPYFIGIIKRSLRNQENTWKESGEDRGGNPALDISCH